MRKILFKAKRNDWRELPKEKWWVEGYYLQVVGKPYIICKAELKCIDAKNTDLYAIEWYEIDPETLCQLTGLKDKNGNQIWENDIVKCNKRKDGFELYKVLWRKFYADFGVEPLEFGVQYPISLGEREQDIKGCDYEVIGNIFDNTELL